MRRSMSNERSNRNGSKKDSQSSLGQINNRLLNLAQCDELASKPIPIVEPEKTKSKKSKKVKKSKKKKKRKYSTSSSASSEASDSDSPSPKKKKKKKDKKKKKKADKLAGNMSFSEHEEAAKVKNQLLEERKRRAPMTKEEWEKQQSVTRREYDEDTGRVRLVKVVSYKKYQ